jgi:hypothetical protein
MQFGKGKPNAGAFYDSDFTTIDQVLAVGLLNGLQGKNDCRVAIVTMSRANLAVCGYVDLVERYYRGPAGNFAQVPPIGMPTVGSPGETSPAFTAIFADKTKVNKVRTVIDTGDPNTLFRNYLEAQYDQNGFFVLAGPATNLAAALEFRGMKDLIAAKIKYLVAALPEQSLKADIPAARKLFAEWPTPIYMAGDDVGTAIEFPGASIDKEFATNAPENPFAAAYRAYKPMPYNAPTWAMAATLYAGRPKEGYFKVSDPGAITIRDDGKAVFAASAQGKHQTLVIDPEQKEKVLQAYVDLTSAKPVFPQRVRPPVVVDDKKADDKKPDDKKPEQTP